MSRKLLLIRSEIKIDLVVYLSICSIAGCASDNGGNLCTPRVHLHRNTVENH